MGAPDNSFLERESTVNRTSCPRSAGISPIAPR